MKMTISLSATPASLKNVAVLETVADPKQITLVKGVARLMKELNYSTVQREDAQEILGKTRMSGDQVLARFDSMTDFLALAQKELRAIRKQARDDMR